MKNRIFINIAVFLMLLTAAVGAPAQTASGNDAQVPPEPVLADIIRSYQPWYSAEFSGRLRYDKLPVSPTVKMYMVRDSLLQVSVRVPLMGEVGRLHITKNEFTVVNRLKRVYCSEPAENLFAMYPTLLSDIQGIFLGRVVLFGSGELGGENQELVGVEEDREGGWMLIPLQGTGISDLNYGYLVGSNSRTKALLATLRGKGSVQILYSYQNRGEQMKIGYEGKGKTLDAELDFTSVKWGGSEMSPLRLMNYDKVSVKEFMASFRK